MGRSSVRQSGEAQDSLSPAVAHRHPRLRHRRSAEDRGRYRGRRSRRSRSAPLAAARAVRDLRPACEEGDRHRWFLRSLQRASRPPRVVASRWAWLSSAPPQPPGTVPTSQWSSCEKLAFLHSRGWGATGRPAATPLAVHCVHRSHVRRRSLVTGSSWSPARQTEVSLRSTSLGSRLPLAGRSGENQPTY